MPCMKKGFQRGAWPSGAGMRRDCWWNPSAVDLRVSQLTTLGGGNHFRTGSACFSEVEVRGAWLSTWVVMLQEVPRLRWYTWTIGNFKAADLELMGLRLGGGQHPFSLGWR